ncbi:MAG TPA: hypothetical protein PKW52_05055 [Nitrospira sp.]|nr:hypothetical protein [Nitrospira sp.]HQV10683.1 hypothetical protein [Nitrospira sp.]
MLLAVMLTTGCSGTKVTSKSSAQAGKYQVHNIVLIPFETLATPQAIDTSGPSFPVPSGVRRSDVAPTFPPTTDQFVRRTHLVPPDAGEKITDLMWAKLKAKPGLHVMSPQEAIGAARDLSGGAASAETIPAHKIAQRLKADAALSGKVLVYQERVGSRLGADPPAAVGFEVKLVAPDGMVLWEGNYYEKQRPMTEDILGFVQRYGTFVTAEELAAYGASELADAFPFGGEADEGK